MVRLIFDDDTLVAELAPHRDDLGGQALAYLV
jgi:hypothetical protein